MNDKLPNEMKPYPVTVTCHPTGVPAAELPMGMIDEIAQVLAVHGLDLAAAAKSDPALWSVLLMALGRVLDNVPAEHGGRKPVEPPADDGRPERGR